ncbi:peptidylprolyl isomerase [Verrucomicrobia bacterium]|nr:peptidylprolyl isomerase [Verrucomicrobiales bacterium]MDC0048946.1 peptidylprolyl isomerase [Verrucomicrobiota bacterium]
MPLTINGELVDEGLLDAEFSQIKAHFEQQANVSCCERDDEFMGYAKENIIARVLLSQKAKQTIEDPAPKNVDQHLEKLKEEYGGEESFYFKLGIAPGNEEQVRKDIIESMRVDSLIDQASGDFPEPSNADIEDYYKNEKASFMTPEEVRSMHIFKSLQQAENKEDLFAEMRQVRDSARAGDDFMELVRKHSDKPEEEADLGWYKRGELMDEFELITFSMEIGEISPVFSTQWGMHLAKLTDRRCPEPIPLENVQDEISDLIKAEHRESKLKTYIEKLKESATIKDEDEDESA